MFPLGSVLFPHMPLQLRVFEDRYLVMLSEIFVAGNLEFGTVLIERGQEVGGGERRFGFGTTAEILNLETAEGFIGLSALGRSRIEILDWNADEPYPNATIREVPDLEWDESLRDLRDRAEQVVRRTLTVGSEFANLQWPSDTQLSDEEVPSAWQLAGISPLTELDQLALLQSRTLKELLDSIIEFSLAAEERFRIGWVDDEDDDERFS